MANATTSASKQMRAQLDVRRGSLGVPIALLLLTVLLFVIYALPSGFQQLALALGLIRDINEPISLEMLLAELQRLSGDENGLKKFSEAVEQNTANWGILDYIQNIVRPLVKIFIEQVASDFIEITKSAFTTLWQLSLYSLVPGLAGLVYRRSFWTWFAASLMILLVINASGIFGQLTAARVMPWSGSIFFFVVSQIVLLLVAFRLRRHVQFGAFTLPARMHNWGLTLILVAVGIACYFGWGPGYRSASDGRHAGAALSLGWSTTARAQDAARGAGDEAVNGGADTTGGATGPEGLKERSAQGRGDENSRAGGGARRSWIWSFLGDSLFYKLEFILIGLPLIYTLLRNSGNWTARSRKNIVICLDGTSNTPDQLERGFAAQTNVYKLFRMLKGNNRGGFVPSGKFDASLCKQYKNKQIAFYYAGVGNKYDSDPILQTIGMATGMGASEIIERAYLDLVRVYQPGDRVYITGFSRGAAIARLLASSIEARGAPRTVWTLRLFGKNRPVWSSNTKEPVMIDVLGCWDTVGSFGVAKTIAGINFQQLNLFKDLTVPDNVRQAYHMVALDEERDSFEPTLMDPDAIRPERIVEVWFAGNHGNVGGGWATDKLSDVTLDFLLSRVSSGYATAGSLGEREQQAGDEGWGIYLTAFRHQKQDVADRQSTGREDGVETVDPDPRGQVRLTHSKLYEYRPRELPLHAVIADAVFDRMTNAMPVYAPQALFNLNDALDAKRDLIAAKITAMEETRSLKPGERDRIVEYKNKLKLRRWEEYWTQLLAERGGEFDMPADALDNTALNA